MGMYEGAAVNWSLMMLSKCIRELVQLRRKKKRFEHVCTNPLNGDLVALLGPSLVGSALTAMFVCVSQAPTNAAQSRHALDLGREFSCLKMDRLMPMPAVPLAKLKRTAEGCLAENGPSLDRDTSTNRFVVRRQAMARDAMARLRVLEQLQQLK